MVFELELNLVPFIDLLVCGILREFKFDCRILEFGGMEAFSVVWKNINSTEIIKFINLFSFIATAFIVVFKFDIFQI